MPGLTGMEGERKTDNLWIRCKPSVKRDFKVMVAELGRSQGDVMEVIIQAYKVSPAIFKPEFI